MPEPILDISDEIEISSTTFPKVDNPTYDYTTKNDRYALISEISFSPDSSFKDTGKIQAFFNGNTFTSKNGALNEISLKNALTTPFRPPVPIVIEPRSSLKILARMASGTGNIQFSLIGVLLTREEYELLKLKTFGVNKQLVEVRK